MGSSRKWVSRLILSAGLISAVSGAVEVLELTPQRRLSAMLPSGEAKIKVIEQCVMCHGGELLEKRLEGRRGWSFRYWEEMVYDMIEGWGAEIERRDIPPIAAYLTEQYGPGSGENRDRFDDGLLADGKTLQLIRDACLSCHDAASTRLRLAARAGLPARIWKEILQRMQRYGPTLEEDELEVLAHSLADGLKNSPEAAESGMAEFYAFLAEGEAKDLIVSNCLSCHGPHELRKQLLLPRADDYYWERTLRRMIKQWEAPLGDDELQKAIRYLNRNYGP